MWTICVLHLIDSPKLGCSTERFLLTTGYKLNCQLEVEVGAPNGLAQTPAWACISVSQSEIVCARTQWGIQREPCVK